MVACLVDWFIGWWIVGRSGCSIEFYGSCAVSTGGLVAWVCRFLLFAGVAVAGGHIGLVALGVRGVREEEEKTTQKKQEETTDEEGKEEKEEDEDLDKCALNKQLFHGCCHDCSGSWLLVADALDRFVCGFVCWLVGW